MDLREELHAYFQKSTLTLNHLGVIFGLEVARSGKLWSGFRCRERIQGKRPKRPKPESNDPELSN